MDNTETIDAHVKARFEITTRLGKGAYGVVWKARDRKTGRHVALKKCFDAFRNATDAQRTCREVLVLSELSDNENIIRLLGVMRSEGDRDLYLIFDLMESDLHAVIKAGILQDVHKRFVIYQLLRALYYLHTAELIHRDLKPANLLLDSSCLVRVGDFGLCRSVAEAVAVQGEDGEDVAFAGMTDYVATRYYRAPEIIIGSSVYTKAVDMWAVGCILGEMLTGRPLFPGSSTRNQLERVMAVTGVPTERDISSLRCPGAIPLIESIAAAAPTTPAITLRSLLSGAPEEAIDLIEKCLVFNPDDRISAFQALRHPYVAEFHNPAEEPPAPAAILLMMEEGKHMTAADYRDRLYAEIARRRALAASPMPARSGGGSSGVAPSPAKADAKK